MYGIIGHAGLILKAAGSAPSSPIKAQLNFEGADGSTTFTDETGRAWYRAGTPTISTAWSAGGTSSGYFPGSGCVRTEDVGGNTMLNWATDDFRIEFVMRPTGAPLYGFIVTKRDNAGTWAPIEISFNSAQLTVTMASLSTQYGTAMSSALALNTDYAVKVERIGTSLKAYIDETEVISATLPSSITYYSNSRDSPLCIGSIGDGSYPFYGYVDNFVITKL